MRDAQDADVLTGSGLGGLRLALPVAAVVVMVDQLTKRWALSALTPGSCSQDGACIDLIAGARLRLVFNTGASFSQGSGLGPLLAIVALVMTVVLLVVARNRIGLLAALFGSIAGGAVGNLVDRVYRADDGPLSGAVVDFIDLGWWPVFNIADSAIVVGVVAIVVISLFTDEAGRDGQEGSPEPGDDEGDEGTVHGEVDPSDPTERAEIE